MPLRDLRIPFGESTDELGVVLSDIRGPPVARDDRLIELTM